MRFPLKYGTSATEQNNNNGGGMDEESLPDQDENQFWQPLNLGRGISTEDIVYDPDLGSLTLSRNASWRFNGLNSSFDRDLNMEYLRSSSKQGQEGMMMEMEPADTNEPHQQHTNQFLRDHQNNGSTNTRLFRDPPTEFENELFVFEEEEEESAHTETKDFDDENAKINLDDKGYHKLNQFSGAPAAIPKTTGHEIFSNYGDTPYASVPKRATCTCSKTKCLKLYCACFKEGYACGRDCKCTNCVNTVENQLFVQEYREKKLVRAQADSVAVFCNCRMSFCEKSYCACAKSDKGCSELCKCFNCKNPKGAKHSHRRNH